MLITRRNEVMGENTHACCCDHSEEALLKRIGELAAEYRGKEGSLIQVLHMANIWLSASGGPEGHSGRSGHQSGRGIGGSDVLFIFLYPAQRRTHHTCLSGDGLLCKGRQENRRAVKGAAGCGNR